MTDPAAADPGVPDGQLGLFPEPAPQLPGTPARLEPAEPLSADRRRTLRQRAQVEAGVHPLMGTRTRPELGTCGSCAHRYIGARANSGFYWKCDLARITRSAATDVRAHWPACDRYAPAGMPEAGA